LIGVTLPGDEPRSERRRISSKSLSIDIPLHELPDALPDDVKTSSLRPVSRVGEPLLLSPSCFESDGSIFPQGKVRRARRPHWPAHPPHLCPQITHMLGRHQSLMAQFQSRRAPRPPLSRSPSTRSPRACPPSHPHPRFPRPPLHQTPSFLFTPQATPDSPLALIRHARVHTSSRKLSWGMVTPLL
jgi:hypothetical protein